MGKKIRAVSFDDDLALRLGDPEFREAYEERRLIQEVALAVRRMREEAGFTQAELATAIGSSQPSIARLERGTDQRTPRWDTLNKIATALGRQLRLDFVERGAAPVAPVVVRPARKPRRRPARAAHP